MKCQADYEDDLNINPNFSHMIRRIYSYVFKDTIGVHHANGLDFKVVSVILLATVCLMLTKYLGTTGDLYRLLSTLSMDDRVVSIQSWVMEFERPRLIELIYWAFIRLVFYFIVPAVFIRFILKESLKDYGLQITKILSGYKIYFVFLLIMFPLVYLVSYTESFQLKYPFYSPFGESLYPNFLIWHLFYLLQFFSLEFFFRGFMVHGTKHKLGFYSIFVMVIPYMMIHFQKPFLESTGAIIAGIVLGALSLRTKSIWQGVFIHYSVAIAMDMASLYQTGYFD